MTAPHALADPEQVWVPVGTQRLLPFEKQKLHFSASPRNSTHKHTHTNAHTYYHLGNHHKLKHTPVERTEAKKIVDGNK